MAIVNPSTLLDSFDANQTNISIPLAAQISDGYVVNEIPLSEHHGYMFNEWYQWLNYLKKNGIAQYDATLSYNKHSRIMRNQNIYRSLSDANNGNDPLTSPTFWQIDQWRMNTVTHNITVDSDYTLTDEQNNFGKIIITDTNPFLTVARNIIVNNEEKDIIFHNDTLQTLTIKTIAGSGIAVIAGAKIWLLCDGVNVIESVDTATFTGALTTDNFFHAQDQKTNGIAGGSSIAGTQVRTVNTILTNTISGASLSSNRITLPVGTYFIEAHAPAYRVDGNKLYFYNFSDSLILLLGSSMFATSADNMTTRTFISGIVTIAASKDFEIRHFTQTAKATDGLGTTANDTEAEVYSDVKIWKVD